MFQDDQVSITKMPRNTSTVTMKSAIMQVRLNKYYFDEKNVGWDEI